MTSQRSTFIIRPSSETMTLRKRSRLIVLGRVIASRLIIASRASCIFILRSSDRDCALFDMSKRRDHRRGMGELQKIVSADYADYTDFVRRMPGVGLKEICVICVIWGYSDE